ncbi:P-loop containing nucleoside triphosphate hydrolase protein [Corynascus novoguineensis]|uniref:P-loop containing nucleoside triphosphate hydrolase protein n=1 Tax=Corynascus novoguineensis TaxID=1126955 RepID=A0AAN7CKE3_9PEZI|nr:P-loop containing nucleoside triphosphate hydrolase protein [Corynascus novoguineensis]
MVQGLLEESSLQLFATCTLDAESTVRKPNRVASQLFRPCTLDITIYGPEDLFEDIGTWFQEQDLYLQDPRQIHFDAKYCNPHKLSVDDIDSCPTVSDVVRQSSRSLLLRDVPDRLELLDLLSNGSELEETQQPVVIRAALKKHQKQALTFMLRREQGWAFGEKQADVWDFLNRVSGAHQNEEPPPFYGGIIADPMGLGKTLTMISLVATDLDRNSTENTTLDIDEDSKHVFWQRSSSSPLLVRQKKPSIEVDPCTSYPAAWDFGAIMGRPGLPTSENWKPGGSILFSVRWRRIILDEAHFIRNGNSRMARAACELDSISRWAVTGTPIQNRLSDLAALLRFIQVYPYDDPKQFEADISRLWKSGEDEEATKRLKCLSGCILLRRTKATISLPARRDMTCAVDFSHEERAAYDEVREQTITKIVEALHTNSEESRACVYVNVLEQIESLRLICDLGLYYYTRHNRTAHSPSASDEWAATAQQAFNVQREMGLVVCLQCSSTTSLTESLLGENHDTSPSRHQPQFFRCLRFACVDCVRKLQRVKQTLGCGHRPSCLVAPVSISHSVLEEVHAAASDTASTPHTALPSKVQALVTDINAMSADVKCVVFSTWRLTLDVVEKGLENAGIRSIRFDGSVPQKERQSVVDRFKADPGIRVMLLTLSCGAVGLTLTVASRAYLMEPHWNPTLEEQALARIHRIGQSREVTTVRFYIRDSFEERVIELQNAKKHLARVLLSPHDGNQSDDSLETKSVALSPAAYDSHFGLWVRS